MSDSLIAALRPLFAQLIAHLDGKPELQRQLATAARAFADWIETNRQPVSESPVVAPPITPPPIPEVRKESVLDQLVLPIPLTPRPTGPVLPPMHTPPPGEHGRDFIPLPLATIAARCRVKAGAAKVQARRAAGATVADTSAEESALRKLAEGFPDCGLWMFDPDGYPRSKAVWTDLAGGYEVCAAAADLLRAWAGSGPDIPHGQEVLTAAAEAQSMLLYAVADVGWVSRDHEQVQMFVHIRELGKQHQIYVPRYLRREDPAEPARWPDLADRLKAIAGRYGAVGSGSGVASAAADPSKVRQKALGNLKYKLKKMADDPAGIADEWPRVVELLDQAVSAGVPPTSLEFRDILLPVYDQVPHELPTTPGVERVFRAVELYRDSQAALSAEPPPLDDPPSAEVNKVADWLRGKEVVLIGGLRRANHVAALKRAFGLADVRWLSTPEHTSFTAFEADIVRPEVAVVLLAIRWSSHDYAEVRQFCDRSGKPLVRLPTGYNANQIAHQIVTQAGERLAAVAGDGFSAGL